MSHLDNIQIFENTVDYCTETPELVESIRQSRKTQVLTLEKDSVPDGSKAKRFQEPAKIVVSKKRTFEAAQAYTGKGDKVCVLNFASASNPGGGVTNGASAQEECLCRVSTLYFCLDTDEMWNKFYKPHRALRSPLHNDDIIYTPDIVVFKTDTSSPSLMTHDEWYKADVLTCAAPNLRDRAGSSYGRGDDKLLLSDEELAKLHEKRDRRIFDVAVQNNVDVLVLGAFGCGAFRNNPVVVARVMLDLAKEYAYAFKVIEFAVFCRPYDEVNYTAFKNQL